MSGIRTRMGRPTSRPGGRPNEIIVIIVVGDPASGKVTSPPSS